MPSTMMKLLVLLALPLCLSLSADFLRAEAGVGAFMSTPEGLLEPKSGDALPLEDMNAEQNLYAWVFLKHPVPLIPNARVEYLALKTGSDAIPTFDTKELDGILYYNLLDNTFFLTVEAGIDLKYIEMSGDSVKDDTAMVGLLFGRVRVEPISWLGVEAVLMTTNYGDNKGYDARLKLDYTMTFVPVVHPALEVGYRIHKLQYEFDEGINKAEYSGVYVGAMIRF